VFSTIVLFVSHFVLNIIQISGIREIFSLLFLGACPSTRSGYRELGLELVSLGDDHSCHPKKPPMVEEKRDDEAGDPFKMLLKESLT
jgi:hypothetical protein